MHICKISSISIFLKQCLCIERLASYSKWLSAFGTILDNRNFGNSPRVGFNGKEKDPETVGSNGNTYDYGFRIYNPSLGRFLSVDPLVKAYPWNSAYAFAENDVIRSIDLDGAERYVMTVYLTTSGEKHAKLRLVDINDTKNGPQITYDGMTGNDFVYPSITKAMKDVVVLDKKLYLRTTKDNSKAVNINGEFYVELSHKRTSSASEADSDITKDTPQFSHDFNVTGEDEQAEQPGKRASTEPFKGFKFLFSGKTSAVSDPDEIVSPRNQDYISSAVSSYEKKKASSKEGTVKIIIYPGNGAKASEIQQALITELNKRNVPTRDIVIADSSNEGTGQNNQTDESVPFIGVDSPK